MTMMLTAALDYARRRWQVFPLQPNTKEPATRRGFYDATDNPATLHRWFDRGFPYNVAIRTGQPSGVLILDADGEVGAASLRELESKYEPFPPTLTSRTARGPHLWFTTAVPIPCSAGKIAPGIDIRGDGGYVVVPPSVHPNGTIYQWANDLPPVPAPDWLVELVGKKPTASISEQALAAMRVRRPTSSNAGAYGAAALKYEIEALSAMPPNSGRNHALNRAAFSLFQLVAGGELDEREVLDRLIQAAHANGLMTDPDDGPRKVWTTIQSGRRAGLQHPRSRSGAA